MGRAHDQLPTVYAQSDRMNVSKFLASRETKQKRRGRRERIAPHYRLMFWFRGKMFSDRTSAWVGNFEDLSV